MIENPGQAARKNAVRDLILGVVFFILLSVVLFGVVFGIPLTGTPKLNEVNHSDGKLCGKISRGNAEDMQLAVDLAWRVETLGGRMRPDHAEGSDNLSDERWNRSCCRCR